MYRTLDSKRIVETAESLALRVGERFPESGLSKVALELCEVARQAHERARSIREPNLALRTGIAALSFVGIGGVVALATLVEPSQGMWRIENFLAEVDSALASLVFLGAAVVFLASLETRIKRRKALDAVAELRAMAHIVDMHQLTKDPEPILDRGAATAHSPVRTMTPFELSRYFDYCSEMLSLIAKIGAAYVQAFPDAVAVQSVDAVETLCTGLSRKIWQKMIVLDRYASAAGDAESKT